MEHAASGIAQYIRSRFSKNSRILLACGSANNGADGLACARLLHGDYRVSIIEVKEPKSEMAKLQSLRAKALQIPILDVNEELLTCDVLVDAVIGTGFEGEFNTELSFFMQKLNDIQAFKIACDVPSGLKSNGEVAKNCFVADVSLTMGALKKSMFLDEAKDVVGEIQVIDLGIPRRIYEQTTNWNLLDLDDMKLPHRTKKNSHKGSFGHLALACGNKSGASIMSAQAALRFGSGLVTLVGFEKIQIPHAIMYSHELPANATALSIGMGLGDEFSAFEMNRFLENTLPLVGDADIFHMPTLLHKILKRKDIVLTPHAKEFAALLKHTSLAEISIDELQKNRFKYVELFCQHFPHAVLLLKGANVIIGQKESFFINPHGTSVLAKGGSGDVLSGMIGALLAQGYTALEAAATASLAHTKSACGFRGASFSLTPDDLIRNLQNL